MTRSFRTASAATNRGVRRRDGGRARPRRRARRRDAARAARTSVRRGRPAPSERIAVGCRGSGLWVTDDAGATWSDAELPGEDVFSVAFSPVDGALYAGTEPSALYVRRGGEGWRELSALRDLPSAPTWSFPPRPWTSHVRWIAPSPHDAAVVLVGIELGGLMRTADGGETWADHASGAQPDVHAIAWHPSEQGRAYEAGGGGAAWSRDGGETWAACGRGSRPQLHVGARGRPGRRGHAGSSRRRPARSRRTARALRRGDPLALARRRAVGGARPRARPSARLDALRARRRDGTLVAGLRDGRLFESRDGGDGWRQLDVPALPSAIALAPV